MKIVLYTTRASNGKLLIGDLSVLILSLLIIISEIPILARNVPNIVFYGLVAAFFISTTNVILNIEGFKKKTILWLVLYLILISVYKLLSISSSDLSYYSTIVKFFFFLVAMLIIIGHMKERQKKFIAAIVILSMLFTVIDNLRLYFQYGPSVYVHLFQWERFTTNSVNTTFVSSQLLFSGILFVVFLHSKKNNIKVGCVILIVTNLLFISIVAQRMIILSLAIVMIPLLILNNQKYTTKRIIAFLVFLIAVILLCFNISSVIDILDKAIGSARLHLRFEQLKVFFSTRQLEAAGGSLSARVSLYFNSINTWFSSFGRVLFGAGDHRITNEIIGNHSDYIDDCARYGIIGAFIWIPLNISFMRQIGRCLSIQHGSPLMRQKNIIMLVFAINALLSSVYEATVGIQLFIFLPIVYSFIQNSNKDRIVAVVN